MKLHFSIYFFMPLLQASDLHPGSADISVCTDPVVQHIVVPLATEERDLAVAFEGFSQELYSSKKSEKKGDVRRKLSRAFRKKMFFRKLRKKNITAELLRDALLAKQLDNLTISYPLDEKK